MARKRKLLEPRKAKSLFEHLDLDKMDEVILQHELIKSYSEPNVSLSFRWTADKMVVFSDLQVKYKGQWTQILEATIGDYSGARTFPLGSYPLGAKLTIAFKLTAYNGGIKMIAVGSQDKPLYGKQLAPPAPQTKPLASGEVWEDETLTYTVSATASGITNNI